MEITNRQASSHKGNFVKSYTFSKKMEIIKFAEEHNISEAARRFKVDRRTVAEWVKKKVAIQEATGQAHGGNRRRLDGGGRKPLNGKLEDDLMEWILERRGKGLRVSQMLIMKKAKVRNINLFFKYIHVFL